jgi:bis(5'-nucleosidyl)-tetraphosphatase
VPFEKSAGAIVFRRDYDPPTALHVPPSRPKKVKIYYLLLHYQMGHWDFPKGIIEKGETIEETARREIKEETGIEDIRFMEGFKEWIKYFFKLKGETIFKIATFLLAETKQKKVEISFEHEGFKWLPFEEALKQITHKNSKEILKKANNFLKTHV